MYLTPSYTDCHCFIHTTNSPSLVLLLVSFIHRSLRKVGEKKIYLLTDAGSEYSDDGLETICAGLEKEGIELIIV